MTPKQTEALSKLATAGDASAYGLQVSLNTLYALESKRLVRPIGRGHMAFPRNGNWQITDAGRAALNA